MIKLFHLTIIQNFTRDLCHAMNEAKLDSRNRLKPAYTALRRCIGVCVGNKSDFI